MQTDTKMTEKVGTTLIKAIEDANPIQIDTLWSILKYKEIGILRKVKCMSDVLHLNTGVVIEELPTDEEGVFWTIKRGI